MLTFLWITLLLLMPITGLVVFLYLRSSFELLELVREDVALWNRLGGPEKVYGRDFANRFVTISPIGPWLSWVYSGSTAGLRRDIVARLLVTRNMLIAALLLFVLTTFVSAAMMLLALG